MPRNQGCWANSLDDCHGPLTEEHRISVGAWTPEPGRPANRKGRLSKSIEFTIDWRDGTREAGPTTVRQLSRRILCEHHNNSSNDLDDEGQRFIQAVDGFGETQAERSTMPNLPWNKRMYGVDGPLLERWLMKLAINNAFKGPLPIGNPSAEIGWPAPELVEMVFGRRSVPREAGAGLFRLGVIGQPYDVEERFTLTYLECVSTSASQQRYQAACIIWIWGMPFGVNFEPIRLRAEDFHAIRGLAGAVYLQPFRKMDTEKTNIELHIRWP